jgi:hypothetical protein
VFFKRVPINDLTMISTVVYAEALVRLIGTIMEVVLMEILAAVMVEIMVVGNKLLLDEKDIRFFI